MKKTGNISIYLMTVVVLMLITNSCKKDDSNDTIVRNYDGSASRGDLVTFQINATDNTYQINNETTGQAENGSFAILQGALDGIYRISTETEDFYAVELTDRIIAANFPSGHNENKLSFGISSTISNVGMESAIAGDYIYIHFSNTDVNGNVWNKEWGIISVNESGTLYVKPYSTGGTGSMEVLAPEYFDLSLPLSTWDIQGSWSVNGNEKVKLNVGIQGVQYTGFAYASGNTGAFLLDMGTGEGYVLGLKISNPNTTITQIAGLYKFVGVVADGKRLAGNAQIKADGSGTCVIETNGELSSNEYFTDITQCPHLPNVLYGNHFDPDFPAYQGKAYFVLAGDIMMYFIFDNEGLFNAYGAGAKID